MAKLPTPEELIGDTFDLGDPDDCVSMQEMVQLVVKDREAIAKCVEEMMQRETYSSEPGTYTIAGQTLGWVLALLRPEPAERKLP